MFYPCRLSVRPSLLKGFVKSAPPTVLCNQSKTLHNCYRHIEDVHLFCFVFLIRKNIIFDKITAFTNLENFRVLANTG